MKRSAAWLLLLCSIAACGSGSGESCERDADCASGFCKLDGTCGPAQVDATPDGDGEGSAGVCTPDHDGTITRAEMPFAAGRMATFRVATNVTWDTAGTSMPDGSHRWDLSGQLAGDADRQVTLGAPDGAWWQASFADATYATELASGSDLRGVFEVETAGLVLLGVVSPDGGTYRTELDYDGAAKVLAWPMSAGKTWSSTSTVSGTASGAVVAYTEKYESRVDAVGTMVTPYGEFPVIRIATDMTRTSGFATVATSRTFTWVAECFGPVATVTSKSFESDAEFSDAAEVRRLAP